MMHDGLSEAAKLKKCSHKMINRPQPITFSELTYQDIMMR